MQTTLVDEYRIVTGRLGATPAQLKELCLNGLRASWLPEPVKNAMLATWSGRIDALLAENAASSVP
jgi:adenosine deaminase